MAACALAHLHVVVYKLVGEGNIGYPEELVRETLAAPLSHPQYQKNGDIGDQMLKNLSSSLPIPFSPFLHGLKLPLHPLYKGNLSSTPLSVGPTRFPLLPPHRCRCKIWGRGGENDVALWDPRVGKKNRETAGASCVLAIKIFLLHPQ
jgi:hypothetical protein